MSTQKQSLAKRGRRFRAFARSFAWPRPLTTVSPTSGRRWSVRRRLCWARWSGCGPRSPVWRSSWIEPWLLLQRPAMPAVEAAAVAVDESSHAAAIELLRDEISTMTNRAEGLEQALFESRKALDALAEEKAGLEEQLQELTVKLAVPSGPFAETPAQTTHQGQGENQGPEQEQDHENDPDWRESELVSLRAELEMAAGLPWDGDRAQLCARGGGRGVEGKYR